MAAASSSLRGVRLQEDAMLGEYRALDLAKDGQQEVGGRNARSGKLGLAGMQERARLRSI